MTASTRPGTRSTRPQVTRPSWWRAHWAMLLLLLALIALPFVLGLLEGATVGDVLANEAGRSKFMQGLLIEVFLLGLYALSYDLILGVTGLLSFGHAMFFAVGAYTTGILLKSAGWPFGVTVVAVIVAGVLQALLFGVVLLRVSGITFALVTLGLASVFEILIKSREFADFTGADVGLQGIPKPDFLNPSAERLRLYFIILAVTVLVYLFYRRFVNSPPGRVCIAIRENEDRARMLGYNTFRFKLLALIIAGITAAVAGMFYAIYNPIVSPEVTGLGYTVDALLIILIGGMGTLSGALIGAGVFRLLDFYLLKWFGENAAFLLGAIYVALVIFVPYGIVGTWQRRSAAWRRAWRARSGKQ
ncbi:MAG: branched-chain amino acid ABC transporter permease [Caldilineaceae bacterium]|nr:branched-chain amino acid ABC transporter permease [Caldilineaceae bacterium]